MKFARLFKLRRKHGVTSTTTTSVSDSPIILGESNYDPACESMSSSTSSSSSNTTLTIPIVPQELIPTSRSGPVEDDDDDDYSDSENYDFENRFTAITLDMIIYPEIFKDLPDIECLGICKSHPHVIKARYIHPSPSLSKSSSSSSNAITTTSTTTTTPIVIKIVDLCSPRSTTSIYKQSHHEATILNTLNNSKYTHVIGHAYIIQLYDHQIFGAINKHVFIYEYCQYGTLFTLINGHGHLITPRERVLWGLDISKGLSYMHNMEVDYRDIKFGDFRLCWSVSERRIVAKIIDLGFSNFYLPTVYELQFSGSADHFAPEMLDIHQRRRGYHPVHADLWAYAVTLYCLFEGKKPFPSSVNTLDYPHLTSCEYYRPQIMAAIPSFNRLLRLYFTEDYQSRPSIQSILESEFFLEFPSEPIIDIELFIMLQNRQRRRDGYPRSSSPTPTMK